MRSGVPPSDGPRGIPALVAPGGTAGRARGNELSKKIYVGNLPWSTTEAELEQMFAEHGSVESVRIITDRETGRSRGFAFVEMSDGDADTAMQALDGRDMGGRALRVNEAQERGAGGGGGGGRGGYGGGRARY